MPRKPVSKKQKITVVVNNKPVTVTMTPPTAERSSYYAYWKGLTTSKSTGHSVLDEAVKAVEDMLRNGGKKSVVADTMLSDAEFEEIQRRHYAKKKDAAAQKRSAKTLEECLDAISAFREISGLKPITLATPDDCERFQRDALEKLRNWRVHYAGNRRSTKRKEKQDAAEKISPNTVLKWSTALQAAFERANRNAGRKCVRGVVSESKLLTDNPWRNFTWIEGREKAIRQFDDAELISLLDYFDANWPGVSFAPAFAKVLFWSCARREEISSLCWKDEHSFGPECHFESTGKWGVKKWFRIPEALRADLEALRNRSDFVFDCYSEQLRQFHIRNNRPLAARQVRLDFAHENLGRWMYTQVCKWSQSLPKGSAYLHVFRKTALQHALSGEHIGRVVAEEAHVTPGVMRTSYARASDEEFRRMSNGTFRRLRASLSVEVATRYGYEEKPGDRLRERLDQARCQGDWKLVVQLAEELDGLADKAG